MNFIIIGDTAKDINIFKNKDQIITNNGGACYYSAVGASMFGTCGVVTKFGNDFDVNNYKKFGIDVSGVCIVKGKTTCFFQKFLSQDGQEREFKAQRNPETKISINDIPLEYLKEAKYIFLSTTLPENQLQLIKEIRKKSNAKIAVDTLKEYSNSEITKEIYNMADIAFIDREFETLINCKAPIKVIKYGKGGCLYISDKQRICFRNKRIIPDNEVIDKTGAGDILIGSFLMILSQTNNPKIALEKSNNIATESILEYGVESIGKKYKKMGDLEI